MNPRALTISIAVIVVCQLVLVVALVLLVASVYRSYGSRDEPEVRRESTTVVETSIRLHGEAGEIKHFTIRPGVWEFIGGASNGLSVSIVAHEGSAASWTGFRQVLTFVDPDLWTKGRHYRRVLPAGPVSLTVNTGSAWTVNIRRLWTPEDIRQAEGAG